MLSASKSGSGLATGYNLTRSLRFRSSASAYLSRTYSNLQTNNKIQTFSCWVKRGKLGVQQEIYSRYDGSSTAAYIALFTSSDTLSVNFGGAATYTTTTTQVFRDASAWYHIVFSIDTTQATAANRFIIYVNGVQVTALSAANYPTQNSVAQFGVSSLNTIGTIFNASQDFIDACLAEVNFIDGQQLTPSSFGSTNSLTGVWQPARYTGSYGTNGFYLPFTDNSALTTASNVGLGKDFSGNGNFWTTNNISITAGVTYDSMTDVPTLTSATAANFPTFNPLQPHDGGYTTSVTNGNMAVSITYSSGANMVTVPSTIKTSPSGKWYWEVFITSSLAGGVTGVGVITPDSYVESTAPPTNNYLYVQNGNKYTNGTGTAYGATFTSGDYIGVALDVGAGTITFYKNNVSQGVAFTGLAATSYYAVVTSNATGTRSYAINFGQQPFQYTAPSGFVALNTYNLPTSTIVKGNTVMDATLYTGTGASLSVTNAASFKPDLVWVKSRSAATDHAWYDSVRGTTKQLESNNTGAETTEATGLTAFGSAGFTVGALAQMNTSAATYVGWQWQAGQGSSSSNTNGTITSTVSVNASAGFSVVTYTGTGANATVGHGLGVAPSMVIARNRPSSADAWCIYHVGLTSAAFFIKLNATDAQASGASVWNSTAPTSSVFSVGSSTGSNGSTNAMVAYCWTPIAGFSAFGSWTGNASTDGPFVYTGFRPKFLLVKNSNTGNGWAILDSARNTYNVAGTILVPNASDAEATYSQWYFDFLSNGFKVRGSSAETNGSGNTIIYAAWAENPFRNSLAR